MPAPCPLRETQTPYSTTGPETAVQANVARVPGAVQAFKIRSTPTFVLLGKPKPPSKKKAKRSPAKPASRPNPLAPRWRASGLIKKDQLIRVIESAGGVRPAD